MTARAVDKRCLRLACRNASALSRPVDASAGPVSNTEIAAPGRGVAAAGDRLACPVSGQRHGKSGFLCSQRTISAASRARAAN